MALIPCQFQYRGKKKAHGGGKRCLDTDRNADRAWSAPGVKNAFSVPRKMRVWRRGLGAAEDRWWIEGSFQIADCDCREIEDGTQSRMLLAGFLPVEFRRLLSF